MKAQDLAHYIINRSIDNQTYIGNLQLQKILYFVNLLYLHDSKKFLVEDEFEAWLHGPVIPEIYNEFFLYGGNKIYSKVNQDKEFLLTNIDNILIIGEDLNTINKSIDYLCALEPSILVKYSQAGSSAWYHTLCTNKDKETRMPIKNELILLEAGIKEKELEDIDIDVDYIKPFC